MIPTRALGFCLLSSCAFGCRTTAVPSLSVIDPALAQAEPSKTSSESTGDLAKKTQNPVADLISVPLQNNFNFGVGPGDDLLYVLNIQPVIPTKLTDDWNLINRVILPVVHQPELLPGIGSESGIGDVVYTAFLSPKDSGDLVWGVGPVIQIPTASDDRLGARRWGLGPSFVALRMNGPWVYGALWNNIWSVGGSDRPNVNQMLLQPFLNYNLEDGWYVGSGPIITADWTASTGERWTVPLGGGAGKVFFVGRMPVNVQLHAYANVRKPTLGPDWLLRFQLQFLF